MLRLQRYGGGRMKNAWRLQKALEAELDQADPFEEAME